MAGLAVVVASGFSFKTIPTQYYQFVAEAGRYPAAPDHYVNTVSCLDPLPAGKTTEPFEPGHAMLCKQYGATPDLIDHVASTAADTLKTIYVLLVLVTIGANAAFGGYRDLALAVSRSFANAEKGTKM